MWQEGYKSKGIFNLVSRELYWIIQVKKMVPPSGLIDFNILFNIKWSDIRGSDFNIFLKSDLETRTSTSSEPPGSEFESKCKWSELQNWNNVATEKLFFFTDFWNLFVTFEGKGMFHIVLVWMSPIFSFSISYDQRFF